MTPEETRRAFEQATRVIAECTGKIASAEKQERHGSPASAKIASKTLPSLRRRLEAAELERAQLQPLLEERKREWFTPFRFNKRTTEPSKAELALLEIPEFLKRKKEVA